MITQMTDIAQMFWSKYIQQGDTVVDATLGNGWDAGRLAELVGADGQVIAMDIQEVAIEQSQKNISPVLRKNIRFILDSHEKMKNYADKNPRAVIFNLGYLPGGSHQICTNPQVTLKAITTALDWLLPLGILSVCAYPGHDEGKEYQQVASFFENLDSKNYKVIQVSAINQSPDSPKVFVCQKIINQIGKEGSIEN